MYLCIYTKNYQKYDLDSALKRSYVTALKNPEFKKLINTLKVKEDIAINYTSKLESTLEDLANCSKCKSLYECKNKVTGFVYYPNLEDDKLDFNYVACKYKKKELEGTMNIRTNFYDMPIVQEIEDDFNKTLAQCQEMTLLDWKKFSVSSKLFGSMLRLIAPLM